MPPSDTGRCMDKWWDVFKCWKTKFIYK